MFYFVVAIYDLVHAVKAMYDLSEKISRCC